MLGTAAVPMVKAADVTLDATPPLNARTYNFSLANKFIAEVYLVQDAVEVSVVVWIESVPAAEMVTFCAP